MADLASFGNLVAAAVTAIATVFLYLVTRTLATETKRMAEASSRPHVVVTIEPNRWSMMQADIRVENTGTGTAYDVKTVFEPPLPKNEGSTSRVPLEQVSVLRPGRALSSYLSEFGKVLGQRYAVTVTWRRDPSKDERDTNTYTLNMADVEGISLLGGDPAVKIAEELKDIRDDLRGIASGWRHLNVDVFSSADRLREQRKHARLRRQMLQKASSTIPPTNAG